MGGRQINPQQPPGAASDGSGDLPITAKGDLIVGTGGGASTRLPVGSDEQVLAVDPTQPTGLRWVTGGSGGGSGEDGASFLSGLGAPSGVLGVDGDSYVDVTPGGAGTTYTKALGTWTSTGALRGPQGIQGIQGDTGEQGIQGLKGDTGAQGIQGIQGEQGEQGIQGIQGIQGEQGDTGSAGDTGPQPPLSTATPQPIGTASAGTGTEASKWDHSHAIPDGGVPLTKLPTTVAGRVLGTPAGVAPGTAIQELTGAQLRAVAAHPVVLSWDAPVAGGASPKSPPWVSPITGTLSIKIRRAGALPASAAGTYTLDVQKNGTTVLSGLVDLEASPATADTWTPVTPSVAAVTAGDILRVLIASSNADLTPAPVANVEQGTIFAQLEVL